MTSSDVMAILGVRQNLPIKVCKAIGVQVLCSRPLLLNGHQPFTIMYKNDLTIDKEKTILIVGQSIGNGSEPETAIQETEAMLTQLFQRGYDTVIFCSTDRLTCQIAAFIRSLKPSGIDVFQLCVLNRKGELEQSALPEDCFDEITVLEEDGMHLSPTDFCEYLLDCSGLLIQINPIGDPGLNRFESTAHKNGMEIVRIA